MQKGNFASTNNRIECPCHNFTALSKILDAMLSDDRERTDAIIDWLNGTTDHVAIQQKKLLTCGKRFQCRYRYGTSFAILRAIRDACAPFRTATTMGSSEISSETTNTSRSKDPSRSAEKAVETKESHGNLDYEQSFPPLNHQHQQKHPGLSNILVPPSSKFQTQTGISEMTNKIAGFETSEKNAALPAVVNTLQARKKKGKRRVQPQKLSVMPSNVSTTTAAEKPIENVSIKIERGNTVNKCWSPESNNSIGNSETSHNDLASTGLVSFRTPHKNSNQHLHPHTTKTVDPKPTSIPSTSTKAMSLTTNNVKNSSQSRKEAGATAKARHGMKRLVDIYVALVDNMLVPSTPLEIHLLLELLSIDTSFSISTESRDYPTSNHKGDNESVSTSTGVTLFFQPILYGPDRCIEFARSALSKLEEPVLKRLSPFLIKSLLRDTIFQRQCPAIAANLEVFLTQNITAGELVPPSSESITGTQAMFNLPFDPDRDNRHNFKTQAEISMYQNREATRDAFLSELRIFMTSKSKVFRPQEVDKVREKAQCGSRMIIANIRSHNILWFAQFFCDLLLQVGLAPLDEMDQEVLGIATRDKLQKLHKRLTKKAAPSRSSHTSRAGLNSITNSSGYSGKNERYKKHQEGSSGPKCRMDSSFQESLPHFPGYQEFFFIFLHSSNNYTFGVHLVHQIVKKTLDRMSNRSPSGLERRILELALLGRFLGFLTFSPNWHEEGIDLNKLKPFVSSLDHGLNLLQSVDLPLSKIVREAWEGGYATLVIPWTTELLKMSKWDSISQSSMNYRQILADLRLIQKFTSQPSVNSKTVFSQSLQLLSFYLETFFNEVFSLPKLTSLPDATITKTLSRNIDSLDGMNISFSTVAMYASSPHMEDLCDMIMNVTKKAADRETKSLSVKPRQKLRPSIVSTTVEGEAGSYLGIESPRGKAITSLHQTGWRDQPPDDTLKIKKASAQKKLIEEFYNQHRDLKEIGDFAVEHTRRSFSVEETHIFVKAAIQELSIGLEPTETDVDEVQTRALELSHPFVREKLSKNVRKTLELFCQSRVQSQVIDVATNLSTKSGMESSLATVRGLIVSSTKIALKERELNNNGSKNETEEGKEGMDRSIQLAVSSVRNLIDMSPDHGEKMELLKEALDRVAVITKSFAIPRETLLRDFFECILDLETVVESSISTFLESGTDESWIILCKFFQLVGLFASLSGYWRNRSPSLFGEKLIRFMMLSKHPADAERKEMVPTKEDSSMLRQGSYRALSQGESKYAGVVEPLAIQFNT